MATKKLHSLPGEKLVTPGFKPPGIRGFRWVSVKILKGCANPLNWKNHSPRQQRAIKASLSKHGFSGVILYNEITGHLIDGHGRIEVMKPEEKAWVAIGQWTPEQERSLLASLDPIGAMAETDPAALRKLNEFIEKDRKSTDDLLTEHDATLKSITDALENHAEDVEFGDSAAFFPEEYEEDESESDDETEDAEESEDGLRSASRKVRNKGSKLKDSFQLSDETETVQEYKSRDEISIARWQPVPPYDIPSLDSTKLGSVDPNKLSPWNPSAQKMPKQGLAFYIWGTGTIGIDWSRTIISFYTMDRRFESCWNNPDKFTAKLSHARPYALVSPNFSIWEGTSRAEEIFQIYRTRFVSRYWQEAGFDVIPDIQLGNLWGSEAWNWRFLGIPTGLPCISVNLQTPGSSKKELGKAHLTQFFSSRKARLQSVIKLLRPQQLLLYHGTRFPKDFLKGLPKNLDVVLCQSHMSEVIEKRKDSQGKQR